MVQLFQGYFKCMTVKYRRKWLLGFSSLLPCWTVAVSVVVWDCAARRAGKGQRTERKVFLMAI